MDGRAVQAALSAADFVGWCAVKLLAIVLVVFFGRWLVAVALMRFANACVYQRGAWTVGIAVSDVLRFLNLVSEEGAFHLQGMAHSGMGNVERAVDETRKLLACRGSLTTYGV